MNADARIYVAGHRGMVGSAIVRRLRADGFADLLTPSRAELDLLDQGATRKWFEQHRPEVVIMAAARVGGIHANDAFSADFIRDNLAIALHSIEAAHRSGVARFLFLGSSCIYPKLAPQPMAEDCLLTGPLEPTNEAYAIAKIAGLKLCQHLPQAVWRIVSFRHADQPVWSGRQLPPAQFACPAGIDPAFPRGEGVRRVRSGDLGNGYAEA